MSPELLVQFQAAEWGRGGAGHWSSCRLVESQADDALATDARRSARPASTRSRSARPTRTCAVGRWRVRRCRGTRAGHRPRRRGRGAKFGVAPASMPDYIALVGDAADGLPGVPGWAPGRLPPSWRGSAPRGHPEEPRELGLSPGRAARLLESLAAHREEALLYRRLATLRDDVPLREDLADLEWRGPAVESSGRSAASSASSGSRSAPPHCPGRADRRCRRTAPAALTGARRRDRRCRAEGARMPRFSARSTRSRL